MPIQKTISPIDGSVYVERTLAEPQDVEAALVNAIASQKEWRKTSLDEREAICRKAVEYFLDNADEIGLELTWQMGRPVRYTANEIRKGFQERAHYMISIAQKALADVEVEEISGFKRFIRRDPLGVVFVVAPWNYPYLTSVNSVIPAIMAGNAVILKHAQQTPLCAERYAAAFEYAGLPKGVFQYLHLNHEQVAQVIADNRINYVAFTGSVEGGHAVQKAINERFIIGGLELGGKDPAYVRADADLADAVENLVDGSFFNSGQSCCGIERIYVHKDVYDQFVTEFAALTKTYILGDPTSTETTLGPMVRTSAAEFAQKQVNDAIAQGAKALIDPQLFPVHQSGTPYFAPQVLVNVNHNMQVMTEETFAPVVGIMPVESDEEAVKLMNDSQYGLTASIWTADMDAALSIGEQVETGTWFMNRCDYLDPALAWTGVKNSGRGCTLSTVGYEALTRPKSFHLRINA
ncbi:aldehyde dehydrogenase family protein [Dyadobacter chenwenxiniae]|uniref:Aldehyde dehydrogenase family protein n=1 Tax=Dyadobacter chenwenxiniae TaxID=2906456 RepID=A0A9X1PIB5_9BACT|nr:aldehyde dehydrogenase family protein [Dyadobacter chenwenxiniae]MCF0061231.1 aldehyde dehydrogenase family protein [Dyadobacter chenwenxiniae]UON81053.1 aldehyde dehydrogenase family protein [Dyadobacter chenwenxiniae]